MPLPFGRAVPCPRCKGRGEVGRTDPRPCPVCEGLRVVPPRVVDGRAGAPELGGYTYPKLTESERRELAGS